MKQILTLFLFISFYGFAQDDAKYLEGNVPEVEGKVVFEKTFSFTKLSKDQVYDVALDWAKERFSRENNRVVFSDKDKGDIAAIGEDYIVFSSSALALDRATMSFRVVMSCSGNQLNMKVNGIRYEYNVSYQREPEKYIAEEWITDKAAINKGKLNRINGKFRRGTIDYVDELFANATQAFSNQVHSQTVGAVDAVKAPQPPNQPVIIGGTETTTSVTSSTPVTPSTPATIITPIQNSTGGSLSGYKQIPAENIPGNIIKMLSQDWMLITAGNDTEFNMMTASWGGLGYVFSKPSAFCFINPTRHTYPLMEKYETYTLSFYTEAYRSILEYCGSNSGREKDKVKETGLTPVTTPSGSKAFNEAWMIIECRKLVSQSLSQESISNEEVRKEWIGKQVNKMFVGEIINVWIK